MKPKVLLLDIETAPNIGYTWGKYEQNVIEFKEPWYILSVAYCWLGKPVHVVALDTLTEKEVLQRVHTLLSNCSVAIAHNGDKFDFKKLNTRFIVHGLKPPAPYKTVDTRKVARNHFGFSSNSLNDLGKELGLGQKVVHTGFDLWKRCMRGEKSAFRMMRRYNAQDVRLLERIYLKLMPWMKTHPTIWVDNGKCSRCQGDKFQSRGYEITKKARFRKLQCQGCGTWKRTPEK